MALRSTGPFLATDADHPASHAEIHQLLAGMDSWSNVAGFAASATPLQAAHDDLPAAGGVLFFPPGYQLTPTAQTAITKPCAIVGSPGSKLIQGGNTAYELIHVTAALDRFGVIGMEMDGRKDNGRTVDGNLINIDAACTNVLIADNKLNNSRGAVSTNGNTNQFKKVRIERNEISNCFYHGIYVHGQHNGLWIEGNDIDNLNGAGVFFEDLTAGEQINVNVVGNNILNPQRGGNPGNAAIQTLGSAAKRHHRFKIARNHITLTSQIGGDSVGIGLDQISDSTIEDNDVLNPDFGECIIVVGYGNNIIGNRVKASSASGIGLLSYGGEQQNRDNTVVGNVCQGGAAAVGNGITFVANTVAGQAISGLLIEANRCYGENFGILSYNDGGTMACTDILITGNLLAGNTTAASFVTTTGVTRANNLPTI